MSLNRRHIRYNAMSAARKLNDLNPHNIARETIDRAHLSRDATIDLEWNRENKFTQAATYVPDNPVVPAATMVLNVGEDGDYRLRWSCSVKFSDPYGYGSQKLQRIRAVPFAGKDMLWGGADIIDHHFPHTYVTSEYVRTRNPSHSYPHSLSGECNFHVTGGNAIVGLLFGKMVDSESWLGVSVDVYDLDMTIVRRVR